jgi:hypothetical protein
MPLTPPKGWVTLQEKARRASDPKELASIIDEMNRMLAECEEADGGQAGKSKPQKKKGKRPSTRKTRRR